MRKFKYLRELIASHPDPANLGGGSLDHQAHVTLTDAQIKALPTFATWPVIVAAPGANKLLVFQQAVFRMQAVAPYTNLTSVPDPNVYFTLDPDDYGVRLSDDSGGLTWATLFAAGDGADTIIVVGRALAASAGPDVPTQYAANQAMFMQTVNGSSGNFTGGDPANTLDIYVMYKILNLTSGRFE
jgi:hypothetical protein